MLNSPKSHFCHFVIRTEWVNLAPLIVLSEGEKVGGEKAAEQGAQGKGLVALSLLGNRSPTQERPGHDEAAAQPKSEARGNLEIDATEKG